MPAVGAAMTGAGGLSVVVDRTASLEVACPNEFVTTTLKCAPLSAEVVGGVVYDALVAPVMRVPLRYHW